MKRLSLALCFVLWARAATAADTAPSAVDKAWIQAMLQGDAAAAAALYAPDAVMYPPDAMEVKGREAIQKSYADMLAEVKVVKAVIKPVRNVTMGDEMVSWGRFSLTVVPKKGGAETVMEGRFTDVQKKIDGKWLYTIDHASLPLPSAPPPAAAPAT